MEVKLNLGCGGAWHVDGWIGIDQRSTADVWQPSEQPRFIDLDLRKGLPFSTNSVDVVFSSHALEHFTYEEAIVVLFEVYRVLKIGAPLCLVVPDMDLYVSKYVERDTEFLTTPEVIGGHPRGNFVDNFLMNFYSDPKFNNTCHKYSYGVENLSHTLRRVGFDEFERVDFHDFSYWPELRGAQFRSPIRHIERFSLSVQCRKRSFDPNFQANPLLLEASRFAHCEGPDLGQQLSTALLLNEALRAQQAEAVAAKDRIERDLTRKAEDLQRGLDARTQETTRWQNDVAAREADLERLHVNLEHGASRVAALEQELRWYRGEVERVKLEADRRTGELTVLEGELTRRAEEARTLAAELARSTEEGYQLRAEATRLEGEIAAREAHLREEESRLVQHAADADRLKAEVERQSAEILVLRKEIANRDQLLRAAEFETADRSSEMLGMRSEFDQLAAEAERLQGVAFDRLARCRALREEIAQRKADHDRESDLLAAGNTRLRLEVERWSGEARELQSELSRREGTFHRRLDELVQADAAAQAALARAVDRQRASAEAECIRGRELRFLEREWREATEDAWAPPERNLPALIRDQILPNWGGGRLRKLFAESGLFDPVWYASQYKDLAESGLDPMTHYIRFGASEGHDPHPLFYTSWYLREYPEVAASGRNPLEDYIRYGVERARDPNPLFDTFWYLERYPDVAQAGVNPLRHYWEHGVAEGRDPNPLFDTDWYLERYPDVAGQNPLAHYLRLGADRDPSPLFDGKYYQAQNPQISSGALVPLAHYLRHRENEGGDPHALFATEWYLNRYPDVASAGVNPLVHYVECGAAEGRDPNPLFDSDWYLRTYPEVAKSGENPLADYVRHGASQGRDPHPLFDAAWYLKTYPDVAGAGMDPLVHYLRFGGNEKRQPNPLFDSGWYLQTYPEAARSGLNPLVHYLEHGAEEGLRPCPQFDASWYRRQSPDVDQSGLLPLAHYLKYGMKEKAPSTRTKVRIALGDIAMESVIRRSAASTAKTYGPLVSVHLPTYNTPIRYLNDIIQSIKAQTYRNWELCIVDDGSTSSECIEYLYKAASEDARIRVAFRNSNGGIAEASQQALEMCTGEYVALVDHDDILAPTALAEAADLLGRDPSAAMVYTDHAMMNDDGTLISPSLKPAWSPEFFLSTNYIVHLKVYRRSILLDAGGFKGALHSAQDVAITCKLLAARLNIVHLPKVLYYWRVHPNSVASASSAKRSIETAVIHTYNDYFTQVRADATTVWPGYFKTERLGAYKLDFPNTSKRRIAVVVPAISHQFEADRFLRHFRETDFSPLPPVHVITFRPAEETVDKTITWHQARTQSQFDEIIEGLDCDYVVFVSPGTLLISGDWLKGLIGYLSLSSEIGAVGGKVLDKSLRVRSGGVLLLNQSVPISAGQAAESDGYWFNNRIATNVEAVSAGLLATPKTVYQNVRGIPFFEYGDRGGIPYCLELRRAGLRVVYTPWSKALDRHPEIVPPEFNAMLASSFGEIAREDRYYHPFYSRDVPYRIDEGKA